MNESSVEFRVTSIWASTKKTVMFCGVPIHSNSIRVKDATRLVVVKALLNTLNLVPSIGQQWRVSGHSEIKSRESGRFVIKEQHFESPVKCEVTLPSNGENFIRFIAKEKDFKGIGEVKAREIWSKFGIGIFDILAKKDEDSLRCSLSESSIAALIKGFEKYSNLKYAKWLNDREIPPDIQSRLFKYHKDNSIQALIDNPYRLITMGMTFPCADDIAQRHFHIKESDPRRLIAVVEAALKRHAVKGGHTVATHTDVFPYIKKLLKSRELASLALKVGNSEKTYFVDTEHGTYHYTPHLIMEKVVAKRFSYLNSIAHEQTDPILFAYSKACEELPYRLTEMQSSAVLTSLSSSISCITGGAGTGKTTVLRTVLRAYHQLGFSIKAVALSGRAAMRLHQSIGFRTSTIAAFLRGDPVDDDVMGSLLVIDEASMVDLPTMYKIILHTNPNVRFLFVGDPDQLPPIGVGLILADIVASKVIPVTELDIVKRQAESTGIPEYSKMIRDGIVPPELTYKSIVFYDTPHEQVARVCVDLYKRDPANTQIITATRKMTRTINSLCQREINPARKRMTFQLYGGEYQTDLMLDDPVIFTKNNYDLNVQNGSLGRLISVSQDDGDESIIGLVQLDDSKEQISITSTLLDNLEPAYGITLHKAQGSQFKHVIVALENGRLVDRSWIYTAITRSEVQLHLVGDIALLTKAIMSLGSSAKRRTNLHEYLRQSDQVI